jgi:hypothetical protein
MRYWYRVGETPVLFQTHSASPCICHAINGDSRFFWNISNNTRLHDVTSQTTVIFMVTAVTGSNLTYSIDGPTDPRFPGVVTAPLPLPSRPEYRATDCCSDQKMKRGEKSSGKNYSPSFFRYDMDHTENVSNEKIRCHTDSKLIS